MIELDNIIEVPGGKIWSQMIYTEASKNLTPIIFLHGGPGSTHDKLKWGLRDLVHERPLIFYDQLGGGKSLSISDGMGSGLLWSIERFVAELDQLIRFYELNQFILFGTSWGASLALEYYFSNQTSGKPVVMILNSPLVSTKMWMEDAEKLKKGMPPRNICCYA